MRALVIDGSTALGFVMADERAAEPLAALEAIERGTPAFAPAIWPFEVANGLIMAERRKRMSHSELTEALEVLSLLPIEIEEATKRRACWSTAQLARQYGLSVYDAAYLELAMSRGATLATGDKALASAARKAGVPVL